MNTFTRSSIRAYSTGVVLLDGSGDTRLTLYRIFKSFSIIAWLSLLRLKMVFRNLFYGISVRQIPTAYKLSKNNGFLTYKDIISQIKIKSIVCFHLSFKKDRISQLLPKDKKIEKISKTKVFVNGISVIEKINEIIEVLNSKEDLK